MIKRILTAACLLAVPLGLLATRAKAADHRDAPGTDGAGEGDITDVFAFLDPNNSTRLVLAMGVNSFAIPAATPSYRFSTEYLYQFKIDRFNTFNEDFVVQLRFDNNGTGQIAHVSVGTPDPNTVGAVNQLLIGPNSEIDGPTNGVFGDPNSIQAFTGLRDDPFVFDLAQFNRIIGGTQDVFRAIPSSPLGPLRGRPVRADGTSGVDSFGGFNASYMVVEFPVAWLGVNSVIHVWGTVSAPSVEAGGYTQFERMGQPAFNTIFIPKPLKDGFNQAVPAQDMAHYAQFVPDALTTTDNDGTGNTIAGRAGLLNTLGLTTLPVGAPLLLPSTFTNTSKDLLRNALLPDVLRLDLSRAPNDQAIGVTGITNGRRLGDDVMDIILRLARQLADVNLPAALGKIPGTGPARPGALAPTNPVFTAVLEGTDFIRPDSTLSDVTVSGNDQTFLTTFPFLAPPNPLPGETGTTPFPVPSTTPADNSTGSGAQQ